MTVDNFEIFTLPSGLRCVVRSFDGPSYCRLNINAGSRDDLPGLPGLAHFVEHTVFRGTTGRTGWQINARAEDVGGGINAYTSREMTAYYVITPSGQLPRALDLLADVVGNPSFPAAELEREKTIIHEEIKSDLDSPDEAIFDEMASLMFAGSGLAHNILGNYESVAAMSGRDAANFVGNLYTAPNMVLSCVADLPVKKIRGFIEKYMQNFPMKPAEIHRTPVPEVATFFETRDKNLAQSHTIMASRIFDNHDQRRWAMNLLRYYLGSGMNSLFFRELREKRGYVYSIDASVNLYSDTGVFYVYFGSAHNNVEKCLKLIERLLQDMAETPMKPRVFERLRKNFAGRTEIANASINKRVNLAGRELLLYNTVTSKELATERLYSITPEQLRACAEEILKPGLSVLNYR